MQTITYQEQLEIAIAEVKAAKVKLRESAARLRQLLDEATSPHTSKD